MSDDDNLPLPDDVLAIVRAERGRVGLSEAESAAIRRGVESKIFDAHGPERSVSFPHAARERAHRLRRGSVFALGALAGAAALGAVVLFATVREGWLGPAAEMRATVGSQASPAMLAAARSALVAGEADAALELAEVHARNFASEDVEEREAIVVEALVELGRTAEAQRALERFEGSHPQSARVAALRRIVGRIP